MSGVAILRQLLALRPLLLDAVPAGRVVAGMLPQNATLPAVTLHEIGNNEEPTMARNLRNRMQKERVQVTALARDWALMKRILKAAEPGPGVHTGMVLDFKVCSILPASTNPEIPVGDDGIFEQSRDFVVTFIEPQ